MVRLSAVLLALLCAATLLAAGPLVPPKAPGAPHDTETACVDCHADPHPAAAAARGAGQAADAPTGPAPDTQTAPAPDTQTAPAPDTQTAPAPDTQTAPAPDTTACETCHTTDVWSPSTFDVGRHASTAFPLEGAHADVSCAGCHLDAQLVGLPTECAGCHVDRHRGTLGGECTECHTVAAFSPVEDFDHDRTRFDLVGPHADLPCADCHEGANERALLLAGETPPTCDACHAASHGEFRAACTSCHVDVHPTFADARGSFDHRSTGWNLEREHRVAECSECHAVGGNRPVSRCDSCHVDPHAGQLGLDCQDCHRPDRWRLARFDHDQTSWPLRGRHFTTQCGSCHQNQQWVGLRGECYDCHAFDAARGWASIPAHVSGIADCQDCHTSGWTWRY